jgi:gliding motility-associated-like protein
LVAQPTLQAQNYNIITLAGNGTGASSGDSTPAVCAELNSPVGTAVDAAGNVYIATEYYIRRVDAITGIITTIMGFGPGLSHNGDGGPAIHATAGRPWGICFDVAGNLYFSDVVTARIRKIDATTGIITTIAGNGVAKYGGDGGPATAASLNWPEGVVVDSKGNVYFCDSQNCRIRKINAVTGIITTVAGTGLNIDNEGDGGMATQASVHFPSPICMDPSGNIYFGEDEGPAFNEQSYRVRRIDAVTGIITTIAGNSDSLSFGDGGLAVNAGLFGPDGLCLDKQGNLYIAESFSNHIRKIDAVTGIISSIAGQSGVAGYGGDGGPALDALLSRPIGICSDAAGDIYAADNANNRVRKISTGVMQSYPNAAISINGNSNVCTGSTITLTATPSNAGPYPFYQWEDNGIVTGTDTSVYTSTTLHNGDTIVCMIIPYQTTCASVSTPASNPVIIRIGPPVTPSVTIADTPAQACIGTVVTFTPQPVNAGDIPTYQWTLNGLPAGSGPTYTSNDFHNGDVISCTMQADPSAPCLLATSAVSNSINLPVKSIPAPAISISGPGAICQDSAATFTATAANAGTAPSYQWLVNGLAAAAGANSPTFIDPILADGDEISCRLIPDETDCPLPSGLLSDTLTQVVEPLPAITFNPASLSIAAGQQVQLNALISDTDLQSYQWIPAGSLIDSATLMPMTIPLQVTTVFELTAISTEGCKATADIIVTILGKFAMPSAFTPNGDGKNDVFRIPPNTYFTLNELVLYDRWGARVFSTRDIGQGWDGSCDGHPSPAGVYVYTVSGTEGNKPLFVKGTVILIR